MKSTTLAFVLLLVLRTVALAQAPADKPLLLQNPTVSRSQIVFSYAGDLWAVGRDGGDARRLTAGTGIETDPRFSPDGEWIAFTGEYDGNVDGFSGERAKVTAAMSLASSLARLRLFFVTGLSVSPVFSGVSFRFGDTCHINHKNSMADFWIPLLVFAGITVVVQFATFGYCIKVYLQSLADDSTQPLPLQSFMPLHELVADLQAALPLQSLMPIHFTFPASLA